MNAKTRVRPMQAVQEVNLTEELMALMRRHDRLARDKDDAPGVSRRFRFMVAGKSVEIQMTVSNDTTGSL